MRAEDDPPSEPFRSKYEARRRLLEPSFNRATAPSIDAARRAFRMGKIAMETEQPHAEAEQHLKEACDDFFPGLHAPAAAVEPGPDVVLSEAMVTVRVAMLQSQNQHLIWYFVDYESIASHFTA